MLTKHKILIKRLLFTLGVLAIYQFAVSTPLPNLSAKIADNSIFRLLNITSGGGYSQLSLFALGLTPYITATIITQLLSSGLSKKMTLWMDQGTKGQEKVNWVTKIVMLVLALLQAPSLILIFKQMGAFGITTTPTLKTYIFATLITVAGTCAAKFLGDELNRHGLGNGASVLIAANIAANLPTSIQSIIQLISRKSTSVHGWIALATMIIGIIVIVAMELIEKRLRLQATRQPNLSDENSYLPIKLNPAGMIPVIFAGGLISITQTLSSIAGSNTILEKTAEIFSLNSISGKIIYASIVFVFGVFYSFTQINPTKIQKHLTNSSTYILGVSYENTENFLALSIVQLSIIGSALLAILALIPYILGVDGLVSLISLLILIISLMEIHRQIKGLRIKNKYTTTL